MDSCRAWHDIAVGEDEPVPAIHSLAHLHKGARGVVSGVAANAGSGATIGDVAGSTIARRLVELGFVAGERIEVLEEVRPGGDPIAVRIGSSIFALRRREALAVLVQVQHA